MTSDATEPRDLLAERIRRLEARIAAMGDEVTATRGEVARATAHLDTLVDLVGRLGRVVDVQGSTLHGEEEQLERKVEGVRSRVESLADGLAAAVERLEAAVRGLGGSEA